MLACIYLVLLQSAYAQTPLQIFYEERTPYAVSENSGKIVGFTANPVSESLTRAGIEFEWKMMPFKRQLATIKANKRQACGIGWFRNADREVFARFSEPIYQDKPTVILAQRGNEAITRNSSLRELLRDDTVTVLVKDGFSYGKYIDGIILQEQPEALTVVGSSNLEMLQLIVSSRADYMFVAEEEAAGMISRSGFSQEQFDLHRFSDVPKGNNRYLACSKQVPAMVIDQFNQALRETK